MNIIEDADLKSMSTAVKMKMEREKFEIPIFFNSKITEVYINIRVLKDLRRKRDEVKETY